jgi:hypothetical protein
MRRCKQGPRTCNRLRSGGRPGTRTGAIAACWSDLLWAGPHQNGGVREQRRRGGNRGSPVPLDAPEEALDDLRRRIAATRWAEQAYPNLIYFNEVAEGNHFAAWQEPDLFTTEIRAAFRSLR